MSGTFTPALKLLRELREKPNCQDPYTCHVDGEVSKIHIFFASVCHSAVPPPQLSGRGQPALVVLGHPWLSLAMASNAILVRLAAGCMACVELQLSWIKCRSSPHRHNELACPFINMHRNHLQRAMRP
jgi:hypothetical protein